MTKTKTLLEQHEPSDPKWWLLNGRHRMVAAEANGRTRLRADVINPSTGNRETRVLALDTIVVDPAVQFEFAYNDRRARKLAAVYDDLLCDPLLVVAANGIKPEQRAYIKGGVDATRPTSLRERFKNQVAQRQPEATAITEIMEETGWRLHEGTTGTPAVGTVSAIGFLIYAYRQDDDALRRALQLAKHWGDDEPKANSGDWLGALFLLTLHGYDKAISPSGYSKLDELVPAVILRTARGLVEGRNTTGAGEMRGLSHTSVQAAGLIRRRLKLRLKPAPGRFRQLP